MPVKSNSKTALQPSVEDDLAEFTSLLPATFQDLKSSVPAPMPMQDAMERASLGKRHVNALLAVAAVEPIGVSELAKRLGLLLSSTSTLVGELSRAAFTPVRNTLERLSPPARAHFMEGWRILQEEAARVASDQDQGADCESQ
jgi:hypothetical protein